MREPLLISACLTGVNCKYSGGSNYLAETEVLKEYYELFPVCPERDGGLPTPRPPAERRGDRVINRNGADVTTEYIRGAQLALETARRHSCTRALLKERSPSCGCCGIYDGTFTGTLVPGMGVAAQLLHLSGIALFGESSLAALLPAPSGKEVTPMKEYEIVAKFFNACAGSSRPQTFFEEAALASTDDFVRTKHAREFEKFSKEIHPDGRIVYTFDNGSVGYVYEFTEI